MKFYPRSKVKRRGDSKFHYLNASRAVNIRHRKSGIGSNVSIAFLKQEGSIRWGLLYDGNDAGDGVG